MSEVDTPHLSKVTGTDPFVQSFLLKSEYLQTSPEFYMKRLLANGSGDIYQLAHVFRDEPSGKLHSSEFMMLEWYRLDFSLMDLMSEVFELVGIFLPNYEPQYFSYQEIFKQYLSIDDVFTITVDELEIVYQNINNQTIKSNMSKDDWLDLLMADIIEPQLSGMVFVHSYPKSKCSLAKIKNNVALRFELYINGVEIANGFDELQDADEQRYRFEKENKQRLKMGLHSVKIDENFLQALKKGLPQCSGVALGIDRLLMVILGKKNIKEVMLF